MPAGDPRADSGGHPDAAADRPLDLDPRRGRSTCRITLTIAVVLVIMVIFLFLRKVSATIIPALAVPVSLIGTCAAMYAFGFSINNMTLLALTLSVGFVVDDAIVMLENIVRHIEGGMRPFEAALKGSREIGFTIVSITFSLIAVFIPVLLMGGMVGRVFREFAVTIAVAIIISGFVSLTLTPMLCARVLQGPSRRAKSRTSCCAGSRRCSRRWLSGYEWSLDWVLRHKSIMLMRHAVATIVGTIWLYIVVPKGFFPTEDTGYVDRHHRGPIPTSPSRPWSSCSGRSPISVRKDPAVDYVNSTVGAGGPIAGNSGRMLCRAQAERRSAASSTAVIVRLRHDVNIVPGIKIFFQPIQNINLGGTLSEEPISVHAAIERYRRAVSRWRRRCATRSRSSGALRDVTTDL